MFTKVKEKIAEHVRFVQAVAFLMLWLPFLAYDWHQARKYREQKRKK